ncbi:cupin domain-containing protein [Eubacteriaceae bacterium ES3]|nr:cupin domain-containing protein [Eubacteriaceae bacterium ES3]
MSETKHKLPPGAMREVLENQPDVSLVRMTVVAGTKPPVHRHPYAQIDYLLKGSAEIKVGSETMCLKAGESLYIPADVEHGFLVSEVEQEFLEMFVPGREDL